MPVTSSADGGVSRREQILQAAQKLFADQGFRETNLGDVAVQLGFRRQAVYHYFPSKEEILYELIDRAGAAVDASARPVLEAGLPPADMLAGIVRNHVRGLLRNADIFRIQFTELAKLTGERADILREKNVPVRAPHRRHHRSRPAGRHVHRDPPDDTGTADPGHVQRDH
jgi:AcrR family transcriptional regulator